MPIVRNEEEPIDNFVTRAAQRVGQVARQRATAQQEQEDDGSSQLTPEQRAQAASIGFSDGSSQYQLPPTYRPKPRTVTGTPGVASLPEDFLGDSVYRGVNLVNSNNEIEREPYNLSNKEEVNGILATMSDSDRRGFLNFLYAKGLYDTQSGPTASGFGDRDQNAVLKLLFISNANGTTWDATLDYISSNPAFVNPNLSTGRGGGRRIPPEQEMRLIMADASHRMLGRAPTEEEVARYIDVYRSSQLSPTAAAEVAVERGAGPEEEAYGFAQMAQLLNRLMGG